MATPQQERIVKMHEAKLNRLRIRRSCRYMARLLREHGEHDFAAEVEAQLAELERRWADERKRS